nr:RNA-directed DNA polymerase, eukaryota [Tanacetum cinerariifolium]
MSDNTKKAQFIHYFYFFSKDSNSTLKNHISHLHCEALKRVSESGQSSMSRDGSIFVYNPDVLREQFARQKRFNDSWEGLYSIYYAKYGNPTTKSSSGTSSSRASGGNQMSRLLNRLQKYTKKKARNDPSLSSEYEQYVNSDFVTLLNNSAFVAFDLLGFWKAKESMFLILSRIAMDIISVQATSVASESAFSTSGRVLSIQRTRLTLTSLEMCLCLKDHLDAQERKQHKSDLENPMNFEEKILDAEVQQNKSIPLSEEEITIDVASSECTMSGSGSGGEKAASLIGCAVMQNPFRYIGVMVGDSMYRKLAWDDMVRNLRSRLSKWKVPSFITLEKDKESTVASKLGSSSVDASFRRLVRDGVERQQWDDLNSVSGSVTLSASKDRWICDLNGDGVFRVKEVRTILDDIFLPSAADATRWVKYIPIKINVFAWRARLDRLPTRRFVVGGI